jgi:hypothetical protein
VEPGGPASRTSIGFLLREQEQASRGSRLHVLREQLGLGGERAASSVTRSDVDEVVSAGPGSRWSHAPEEESQKLLRMEE